MAVKQAVAKNRGAARPRKIDLELLQQWVEEGMSTPEIAQKFGVTQNAVRQSMSRENITANRPPTSITGRTNIASFPLQELSDAARLDLQYLWFTSMARAKKLQMPRSWKEILEVQNFVKQSYDTAAKLFGWDAKSAATGAAINVQILAQAGQSNAAPPQTHSRCRRR